MPRLGKHSSKNRATRRTWSGTLSFPWNPNNPPEEQFRRAAEILGDGDAHRMLTDGLLAAGAEIRLTGDEENVLRSLSVGNRVFLVTAPKDISREELVQELGRRLSEWVRPNALEDGASVPNPAVSLVLLTSDQGLGSVSKSQRRMHTAVAQGEQVAPATNPSGGTTFYSPREGRAHDQQVIHPIIDAPKTPFEPVPYPGRSPGLSPFLQGGEHDCLTSDPDLDDPRLMAQIGGLDDAIRLFDRLSAELDRKNAEVIETLDLALERLPVIHFTSNERRQQFEQSLDSLLMRLRAGLSRSKLYDEDPDPPSILRSDPARDGYFSLQSFSGKYRVGLGMDLPPLKLSPLPPEERLELEGANSTGGDRESTAPSEPRPDPSIDPVGALRAFAVRVFSKAIEGAEARAGLQSLLNGASGVVLPTVEDQFEFKDLLNDVLDKLHLTLKGPGGERCRVKVTRYPGGARFRFQRSSRPGTVGASSRAIPRMRLIADR